MVDLKGNRFAPLLKSKMSAESYEKLTALENERLFDFVGEYVELCQPASVYMCDDSDEDSAYIRRRAVELGEEAPWLGPVIPFTTTDTMIRESAGCHQEPGFPG